MRKVDRPTVLIDQGHVWDGQCTGDVMNPRRLRARCSDGRSFRLAALRIGRIRLRNGLGCSERRPRGCRSLGSATAGGDGGSAVRDGWQPDNQANEHETMTLTHRRSILLNSHIVFDRLQDQVLVVVKT